MAELHEEVLSAQTSAVFGCLGTQVSLNAFYLAGGTAAALQLGHRLSLDLDLFSERRWSWDSASQALSACGNVTVDIQEPGTFVGSVSGVRVSLFHYPHVLIEEPVPTRFGIPLAPLADIGCMKLVAVAQRGSKKDFVDIYQLGAAGYTVRDLMRLLERKMPAVSYNPTHIIKSLAYSDDAEQEPDPIMLMPYDWSAVREYCARQAEALLSEIIDS
ncbi:MAG: nucleotidyl transferase AbiEii/AbiGii toxin family protein [Actinobacteria bacterium]|nr:nucleotidyl transferase AbiEii/AbiGii toxin family protein [Actinomycetota bacterium]MCG2807245.1 nucleotidyl transferase AbiEii/AbiGii toxin family protein [Coriobacteriia bacterium]